MSVRPSRRWFLPTLIAGICVAGVAGSFGQSSASPAGQQTATARVHRKVHRLPDTRSLYSGVVGLSTAARDSRAKINIYVPKITGLIYLDPKYRTPKSLITDAPRYFLPRHPVAHCRYEEGVLYNDLFAVKIKQPNPKKDGVVESVGQFPATHVSALAFGSIPVTATLYTSQVRRAGKIVPIRANTIASFATASTKTGDSCDPDWESGASTPPLGTIAHGELNVRVSNVRVDQQPVDVGRRCHTVTPLRLRLFGLPGYIAYTGGTLLEKYSPQTVRSGGNTYPVHPGSRDLTIPRFVDCVNPSTGEDLSRLLTAAVSGPGSTVAVRQSTAVLNGISSKHVTLCMKGRHCVKLPTYVNPPKPGMTVHRRHH